MNLRYSMLPLMLWMDKSDREEKKTSEAQLRFIGLESFTYPCCAATKVWQVQCEEMQQP